MKIKSTISTEGAGQAMDDLLFLGFENVSMERYTNDDGNMVVEVIAESRLWEIAEEDKIGYDLEGGDCDGGKDEET